MKNIINLSFCFLMALGTAFSQAEVNALDEPIKPKYTRNTFQSNYIINMQSVEMVSKQNLQFQVAHHFGIIWNKDAKAGQNFAQVLGLNSGVAHTYVSLDYSLFDHTNLGIALAGDLGFEGWIKLKLLRQQSGVKNIPLTLAWLSLANVNAQEDPKTYTLTEMKDRYIGKVGTKDRDEYEYELRMDFLGKMIKAARQERNLTQEELGRLIGVQKAQISKLESSTNSATIDTIIKVFRALKAEINFNVKLEDNFVKLA